MTEEQAANILRGFAESKSNVHTFFTNVIKAKDTTKTGYLTPEELGLPKIPVRTYKELELFSRDVYNDEKWGDYFKKLAEITTSTSLSKEAILIKLAVTQKKELADVSPNRKAENKGWFKSKKQPEGERR